MKKLIDPLSVVPIHLECAKSDAVIGLGTGFIVNRNDKHFLITNWHVVTGRHRETGKPLSSGNADPDTIHLWLHQTNQLGSWRREPILLLMGDAGGPIWLEHPQGTVDVVAVPMDVPGDCIAYCLDLTLADTDLVIQPSEPVSIIGFPLGQASAGKFPIWKTGHVASDIDLDYGDSPCFLIDATTRPGMSGAPVIARRIGSYRSSQGLNIGGEAVRFLGVYSGRTHLESDVGIVWKPHVLVEILTQT